MLTTEEKIQLWEWVAEYAAPEKLLIAGTGVESVRETVALHQSRGRDRLQGRHGSHAALLQESDQQRRRADARTFRAVADQTQDPDLHLQLAASHRHRHPTADAVAALAREHPNIIAIKESSGNLEKVMQMIREVKKGFQVLTGSAPTLAPSLAVGAVGAVLAFANAAPYATISIWEAHRTREPEAALDWQNRIGRAA